jgi:hypothetical protein
MTFTETDFIASTLIVTSASLTNKHFELKISSLDIERLVFNKNLHVMLMYFSQTLIDLHPVDAIIEKKYFPIF